MRTLVILVLGLSLLCLVGCDDGGGGEGGDGGSGSGSGGSGGGGPVWLDGPEGHVYVYAGPLYDVDARNGSILRTITFEHPASSLQATADRVFFDKFDAEGTGRVFSLGLDETTPVQLGEMSSLMVGIAAGSLVGIRNSDSVVLVELATGATEQVPLPGNPATTCSNGSVSGTTLTMVCFQYATGAPDAGVLTFDVVARNFGSFVPVKTGASTTSMGSSVTATPAGTLFALYEGGAAEGTRTVFKVDPVAGTVSAGVAIAGASDISDEQAALGGVVYLALYASDQIVPFDVATMTALAPIAIQQPRHLRSGGGMLWATPRLEPAALAKIDPATGGIELRSFPLLESSMIDSLAYGGE